MWSSDGVSIFLKQNLRIIFWKSKYWFFKWYSEDREGGNLRGLISVLNSIFFKTPFTYELEYWKHAENIGCCFKLCYCFGKGQCQNTIRNVIGYFLDGSDDAFLIIQKKTTCDVPGCVAGANMIQTTSENISLIEWVIWCFVSWGILKLFFHGKYYSKKSHIFKWLVSGVVYGFVN